MSTCPLSGIAPPDVVTLAAAADGDDSTAVVVKNSDCDEEEITAVESENPGEYMINASYLSIKTVASYPEVASLRLWNNQISEFKSVGTSVKQIDLTSNQLTTLDGFDFPSSLQQLTLDLNAITSTKASNFPDSLLKLYLRKNSISSLAKFRFPSSLQSLYINGNQELDTLEGAVLPDSLVYLECSDCRVTSVAGVVIPTSLKTLTLGGTTLTSFVVRESDVTVLQSAALSLTTSISSCTTGTLTPITDNINACVLDDVTFLATYPSSADSGSSDSTAASSSGSSGTSSSSGGTTGGATGSGSSISSPTASPGDTGASSGSSGSNTGVIAGIIAAVVVVLAVIGFLVYRRRRRVSKDLPANSVGTTVVMLSSEDSKDGYIGSIGTHATGSTGGKSTLSGFMSNDVRNDEELIPYRLPLEEIELQDELGAGAFGVVHLAMLRGQQLVVVKSINPKASAGKDVLTRFMDEIRLYARMDHPKIVQFVGVAWTNLLDLSLILEFMPNGDLADLLKASRRRSDGGRQTFSWLSDISRPRSKIDIALDVAEALVYLHSFNPPIIHRDLKARNVLLSAEWEAKVSDFGISREMSEEVTMTGGMGTTPWIAPEVLQGERYSEKADIYSFGILLSEIDTCGHPFNSNRSDADKLTDAKIALLVSTDALKPTIEPDCPAAIRDLILRCVSFNPDSRPNAIEFHYQLRRIRNATMGGGFF